MTAAAAGGSTHIRAAVLWSPNTPLSMELLHMPRPKRNEVLLRTRACGVCHSDLHVIKGTQPFPVPAVLGHEVSGTVVAHGPGTDAATARRLPLGARAVAAFLMPCAGCGQCLRGRDDLCRRFFSHNRARGVLYDGDDGADGGTTRLVTVAGGRALAMYSMAGLAEYCVAPAAAVAPLPPGLGEVEDVFAAAATLGCAAFTAYGALRRAGDLRAGETVAVVGVGGVGSACVQLARAMGAAAVVAVDVDDAKLARARRLGATHAVNAAELAGAPGSGSGQADSDAVARAVRAAVADVAALAGGDDDDGVDVAVEALGRPATAAQAAGMVRPGGRAVVVGLPRRGEALAGLDMTRLVRQQVRVVGSYGARAREDLPVVLRLAETGAVRVQDAVTRRCGLEEAGQAYVDLAQGKILGRALVEFPPDE